MKIAKEFSWEMGHRLPFHEGLCRNIHGHSYKMVVELIGEVNKSGMIIDFYDLGKVIKPIIENYDHSFLCWENDKPLREFLEKYDMKRVIVSYQATVENICNDLIQVIYKGLKKLEGYNFERLIVKIFETPNSFAESSIDF
ncbi:MAG: 6-pyruvoyl tetrahydropterin synthase family protein [Ignavibacteria bacterium]|jgi:6-pyruvoyltetrahydropterin/6-carboxytetrahydropterin synthase